MTNTAAQDFIMLTERENDNETIVMAEHIDIVLDGLDVCTC